ncbi:MAG: patatin-like phospholipase family protein [Planctomycetota bacterium]|nr:patatin-like phospholipase family protein [Planctomycetota bacterium]
MKPAIPPNDGIALCLSGGGYRAAIFHLGAVRWLNECGLLPRLKLVSCVSGGSILGAHLAFRLNPWPTGPLSDDEWRDRVVEPFRKFIHRDIRTSAVLVRCWPWNWLRAHVTAESLRRKYARYLFEGRDPRLADILAVPKFVFCATDMSFGVNWESTRSRVGDYQAGYVSPPPDHWTLSRAVAASSCFPPVFPPIKTGLAADEYKRGAYRGADRDHLRRQIRLTDGGVYDNLGLQPARNHSQLLVSDGGGAMQFANWNRLGSRVLRYANLLQNGIGKLRRSWLMMDYGRKPGDTGQKTGALWSIHDSSGHAEYSGYGHETAKLIASIRTDLNTFTAAEFEILQNHGYLVAAQKTIDKCPQLLPNPCPAERIPYPDWNHPDAIAKALRLSPSRFVPFRKLRTRA